ncbi:carbonic anhydrase, putative [Plasmodium yoelii]|uniref:Carbonic anhydrase, putative n=1 Tax=Plasmodium yoelii TaxID=5861 RepID=A0A078KA92_PLAYE|nr:carbonic anhydrase, putative [Plasmodium yoelii]
MKHIIFLSIVLCFCDNVMYNNYVERMLFELPNNITDDLNSDPIVEYKIKEKKNDNIDINKDVRHWDIEINEHKDDPNIQRNIEWHDNNDGNGNNSGNNSGNNNGNNSGNNNDDNNDNDYGNDKNWEYNSNYNDEEFERQNENERDEFSLKNEVEKNSEERKERAFDESNEYADFENMNDLENMNNIEKEKKKYFEDMQSKYVEDNTSDGNKEYMGEMKNQQNEYEQNEHQKNEYEQNEHQQNEYEQNEHQQNEYEQNEHQQNEYEQNEHQQYEQNEQNEEGNIKNGMIQNNENLSFNYAKHGMDWNVGICKNGKYQSPVDLHMHTLKERELKNLSDFYLNAFYDNDEYSWNNFNRPWFKGDIFYYYENLINKIIINRQNNMFKIKASNNEIIPFGVLFTTDEPTIFYSHHINFHSPSEHTFEGSGNRRHIEMQIYHSTNEIYDYDENKWNGVFEKKNYKKKNNETNIQHSYILTFLMNSLSNPHLGQQYTKNKKRNKRSKSLYNSIRLDENGKNTKRENQYQVISITFSSAEIDKSTINNFKKLPSEKFLKTILEASQNVPVGSDPKLVNLKKPLNLNSLLMMLNMKSMEFFAYHGSSTSPDCNENVHWKVAKKSLPISTETMLKFYNMLKKTTPDYNASDNDNFRALQNVQGNIHNYGRVYLIQGFPVQLLISSALTTSEDKNVIENIKLAYSKSSGNYIYFNLIFLLLIFMFLQNY